MNFKKLVFTVCALLLCFFLTKQNALASTAAEDVSSEAGTAAEADTSAETDAVRYAQVFDDADLFEQDQVQELETLCQEVSSTYDIDVIILTTPGIQGSRKQYLEDYYDSRDTELSDSMLLLLNMDPNDRGIEIQGYGSCEYSFSNYRVESILDAVFPYLKDGNYFEGLKTFTVQLNRYLLYDIQNPETAQPGNAGASDEAASNAAISQVESEGQDSMAVSASPAATPVPHKRNLAIAAILSVLAVCIMFYRSSGRMTAHQGTYLDSSNSRILGSYDRYIRTTTSKRPKPKPQNSGGGGGGGGGRSSGGHSHSGGGRSF